MCGDLQLQGRPLCDGEGLFVYLENGLAQRFHNLVKFS